MAMFMQEVPCRDNSGLPGGVQWFGWHGNRFKTGSWGIALTMTFEPLTHNVNTQPHQTYGTLKYLSQEDMKWLSILAL